MLDLASLIQWDINTFYLINSISNPILNNIMILITHIGSIFTIGLFGLLLFFNKKKSIKKIGVLLLLGLLIHTTIVVPTKLLVDRDRPVDQLIDVPKTLVTEQDPSFPSGHSGRWFILAVLLWSLKKKRNWNYLAVGLGTMVAISRIYVGVHFPLDIVGGIGFGIFAGYLTLLAKVKFTKQINQITNFNISNN